MALTNCKECGKQVSTSASTCPNCGAPTKMTQVATNAKSVFIILVAVLLVAFVIWEPEKKAETSQSISTPPVATSNTDIQTPKGSKYYTADEMEEHYAVNEIAFQQEVDKTFVIVEGVIASIDLDFMKQPVLRLELKDKYAHLNVQMSKGQDNVLKELRKGMRVKTECEAFKRIMNHPYGTNCLYIQ